jgi:hypothetical protein
MEGFDPRAEHLQLAAVESPELDKVIWRGAARPVVHRFEPRVPFHAVPCQEFTSEEQYDFVCLARSPAYTPAEADGLFDELRTRFIDANAVAVAVAASTS